MYNVALRVSHLDCFECHHVWIVGLGSLFMWTAFSHEALKDLKEAHVHDSSVYSNEVRHRGLLRLQNSFTPGWDLALMFAK